MLATKDVAHQRDGIFKFCVVSNKTKKFIFKKNNKKKTY